MECRICGKSNPEDNHYCGACGTELTDTAGAIAKDREQLDRQIEQAVEAKRQSFAVREEVELKASERVIERAWKWITRFGYVIGIPVTAIGFVLGFLGVSTITEVEALGGEAEARLRDKQANLKGK